MVPATRPRYARPTIALLAALLSLGVAGCGDDDDNPTGPGTPRPPTQFDEMTAVAQAQAAAPQAVTLVQSMTTLAGGVGKDAASGEATAKNYGWNEENQRWEYTYEYDAAGFVYHYFYTVQYLDDEGTPQQSPAGAASIRHQMTGTGDYDGQQGDATIVYDYVYEYDVTIAGIGTGTLVMTGGGGYDFDYAYTAPGSNFSQSYVTSWEIQGAGITHPAGGCPTGTIRYDFDPYHALVVFNGTNTATTTLYNANGTPVAAGGSNHTVGCTQR